MVRHTMCSHIHNSENIIKSTAPPEWDWIEERGGYTVQPVPAPLSTKALTSNNIKEGGSNQKLTLFNLGKAINSVISKYFILTFLFSRISSDYFILLTLQVGHSCLAYY